VTADSQTEENNFYDSIIIAKNVSNAILEFFTLWNWEKNEWHFTMCTAWL